MSGITLENCNVATLGSHSALNIFRGAKAENLGTVVVATPIQRKLYERYSEIVDRIIEIPSYEAFPTVEDQLNDLGCVVIPHGSFVAYLGMERNKQMRVPYFGNKNVLDWEESRERQRQWFKEADVPLAAYYSLDNEEKEWPVIVKTDGAAGGKGYFIAKTEEALRRGVEASGDANPTIQHYELGVPLYIHYFQSVMRDRTEILSMDRRYETNVDGLGRLPAPFQIDLDPDLSYVVIGNIPVVLRESMLEEAFEMGERFVDGSKRLIDPRGLWGPFCLETIVMPSAHFSCIEASCRIVAGTTVSVTGESPYAQYLFPNERMGTGTRIARELKEAIKADRLSEVVH